MSAWQSMRSAPDDGGYFLAVRYVEVGDDDFVPEYHVICWEDWDEPGYYDQEGQEAQGPFTCWKHLDPAPEYVKCLSL